METLPTPIIDWIRQVHHNQDNVAIKGLLTDPGNWTDRDQVITFQGHVYVPKDRTLHGDIIRLHHDTAIADTRGITRRWSWCLGIITGQA